MYIVFFLTKKISYLSKVHIGFNIQILNIGILNSLD